MIAVYQSDPDNRITPITDPFKIDEKELEPYPLPSSYAFKTAYDAL